MVAKSTGQPANKFAPEWPLATKSAQGGLGIEIREEGGQEYLYVCAYQHLKTFAKMDLKGETVWQKYAPMEAIVCSARRATMPPVKPSTRLASCSAWATRAVP